MREFVPASRPEALNQFAAQPVMGVFDGGTRVQYPVRYNGNGGKVMFHEYWALAFPSEQIEGEPYQEVRTRLFPHDVQGIRIGNSYYSDMFDKLPSYMYPSGHLASIYPVSDEVDLSVTPLVIEAPDAANRLSGKYMDSILRDREVEPILLVGNLAIANFLNGYLDSSESDSDKYMPSRETEYLLPRVDWDVLSMIVAGRVAGVPLRLVDIPEEHRYRVIACVANVIAHYYTEPRSDYDLPYAPLSEFRDERHWRASIDLSRPLHKVMGMFHNGYATFYQAPYNPTLACLLYAYGIKPQEMVESVQQIWQMREYWNSIADEFPLENLHELLLAHYGQLPDTENAKRFISGVSPERLARYNELIGSTVIAATDPYHLMIDRPLS